MNIVNSCFYESKETQRWSKEEIEGKYLNSANICQIIWTYKQ